MASLKEVKNRINSVVSTQQITKAMKMVAAAKLRRAQEAILQMRPYANKLEEILSNVSSSIENTSDNVYGVKREKVKRACVIVITSDKGLCGGFNANVHKAVISHLNENYSNTKVDLLCVGKKGFEFFSKRDYKVIDKFWTVLGDSSFENIKRVPEYVMDLFVDGYYDRVDVVYNEFKNVATQIVRTEQFLPIVEKKEEGIKLSKSSTTDYLFEPSQQFIIEDLIPKSLKLKIFKCVLDSNASEQGARMTAMDKATENSGELLKKLRLEYNRSRQAAITTEILEIVGGAEALASGK